MNAVDRAFGAAIALLLAVVWFAAFAVVGALTGVVIALAVVVIRWALS